MGKRRGDGRWVMSSKAGLVFARKMPILSLLTPVIAEESEPCRTTRCSSGWAAGPVRQPLYPVVLQSLESSSLTSANRPDYSILQTSQLRLRQAGIWSRVCRAIQGHAPSGLANLSVVQAPQLLHIVGHLLQQRAESSSREAWPEVGGNRKCKGVGYPGT